ncbi:MAG: hypothetical protein JXR34_13315 [Bacteroidales bacterium]|nr:hypothetical protein [Bacteroidales bacterium]
MDYKEFYVELGKLLYAVAKADGEVQDEELYSIYQMVISDLSDALLFDRDDEVDAYYTEFEFEALIDKNADMHVALKSFMTYFDANQQNFTSQMRATTLKAVEAVAMAFEGIVPEEQKVIDEIRQKLKN